MKYLILFGISLTLLACESETNNPDPETEDTVIIQEEPTLNENEKTDTIDTIPQEKKTNKVYGNEAFRDVTAMKTGANTYSISGQARVYEGTVNYVVEDGHNELLKGFATAEAGGPAWGNFNFSIEVKKQRAASTLMLILFETSAMDGSRKHELPIALPTEN